MAKNQNTTVPAAVKKTGADEKKEALTTALAQIEKQFGKGAIMKLGDSAMQVEAISTGSLGLDLALGVGGVPRPAQDVQQGFYPLRDGPNRHFPAPFGILYLPFVYNSI